MTEPQTITEFIEERLAEDEAAAREAIEERRRVSQDGEKPDYYLMAWPDTGRPAVLVGGERVLREITAKRRVLDRHCRSEDDTVTDYCTACTSGDYAGYPDVELDDCPELQDIAYIWNDHPDWNQRWCPHVEGRHEVDATDVPPARGCYTNACNRCGQGDGWHYRKERPA